MSLFNQFPVCKPIKGKMRPSDVNKQSFFQRPLVTIITVVFNGERDLERTLSSVTSQEYNNIEFIVIDGGSTDHSIPIIKSFEHSIDYWVSESDQGIYDAMNKGIELSSGEWINFMNVGDSFVSKATVREIFERNFSEDITVLYGDTIINSLDIQLYSKARKIDEIKRGMVFCHQSSFVRASYHKKNKFSMAYRLASDYHFFLNAFRKKNSFYYLGFPVANYLSGGLSDKKQFLVQKEYAKINGTYHSMKWKFHYFAVFYYHYLRLLVTRCLRA